MAYTTIDDPSAHFQSEAFTTPGGASSTTFDGNSDLQPDMIWAKQRNAANGHELWDSTRGVNSTLFPDNSSVEDTAVNRLTAFNSDGFSWGNAGNLNTAGNFVAWAWKANGGSTSSNTDGSITSTVQANTTAGFSIGTFTGTGSTATVGHGLGVKPDMLILKSRDNPSGAAMYWMVAHLGLDDMAGTKNLFLDTTFAADTNATVWANTAPTSSVFTVGTHAAVNYSGNDMLFYAFNNVQGYSKFGTYTGNGRTDIGAFINTGFRPAFILIKSVSSRAWYLFDDKREGFNSSGTRGNFYLQAQDTDAESANNVVDILSNGFQIVQSSSTQFNGSGEVYTWSAWAENPFVSSTGVPTTAR